MRNTKTRRLVTVGVIGAALIGASLVAASQAAVANGKPKACTVVKDDGRWPTFVNGRPAGIDPNTTGATYMWHDNNGWHIRVTHHKYNRRSFSGQITTGGTFAGVRAVHLEKNDTFAVSADKHSITFSFINHGWIDGLNFYTKCAPSITFGFQSDSKTQPVSRIIIGKNSTHPTSNPFIIAREKPVVTTTTT